MHQIYICLKSTFPLSEIQIKWGTLHFLWPGCKVPLEASTEGRSERKPTLPECRLLYLVISLSTLQGLVVRLSSVCLWDGQFKAENLYGKLSPKRLFTHKKPMCPAIKIKPSGNLSSMASGCLSDEPAQPFCTIGTRLPDVQLGAFSVVPLPLGPWTVRVRRASPTGSLAGSPFFHVHHLPRSIYLRIWANISRFDWGEIHIT